MKPSDNSVGPCRIVLRTCTAGTWIDEQGFGDRFQKPFLRATPSPRTKYLVMGPVLAIMDMSGAWERLSREMFFLRWCCGSIISAAVVMKTLRTIYVIRSRENRLCTRLILSRMVLLWAEQTGHSVS